MDDAWKAYAADFDALTDEEVERERANSQNIIDEEEKWTEAVASWEAAGKPRSVQP